MSIAATSIREPTQATLQGDPSYFGTLFQYYRPQLLAHALRICGNTPYAQDAVQDAFISAFTHVHTLRDANLFFPWLKKILENHCYMMLRKNRFTELTNHQSSDYRFLQDSVEKQFECISNQQRLSASLKSLSEELRSCVMLRYFSSFSSYEDISITLDIPVGTVRSRLNAARQKLTQNFIRIEDVDDTYLNEAKQWSMFYTETWNNLHHDLQLRNELYNHFLPQLKIRFTSGRYGIGRTILEQEINEDLYFGTTLEVQEVTSSGNVSVLDARIHNLPEHTDRCPPSTTMVVFRNHDKVNTAHIFDSARLPSPIIRT